MVLTVATYADFKAAVGAVTKPSVVYATGPAGTDGTYLEAAAIGAEATVSFSQESFTTPIPTEAEFLTDFPKAINLPSNFEVDG